MTAGLTSLFAFPKLSWVIENVIRNPMKKHDKIRLDIDFEDEVNQQDMCYGQHSSQK
jgi:hypothetical protein